MSEIVYGHYEYTAITFNPMVPLNPETNEAIYSTMSFVKEQAEQIKLCCGALTFDQPLYLKANMIKTNNGDEFKSIHLRLGGFHQLMSFLGTIGKLYEGSGIENVWESVYAKKSIPKMLTGKAYSKCLRACLLTDVALHAALLQSNSQENQDDDCINQYENACDSEDFNIIEPMMFRESDDGNIFSNIND